LQIPDLLRVRLRSEIAEHFTSRSAERHMANSRFRIPVFSEQQILDHVRVCPLASGDTAERKVLRELMENTIISKAISSSASSSDTWPK